MSGACRHRHYEAAEIIQVLDCNSFRTWDIKKHARFYYNG